MSEILHHLVTGETGRESVWLLVGVLVVFDVYMRAVLAAFATALTSDTVIASTLIVVTAVVVVVIGCVLCFGVSGFKSD